MKAEGRDERDKRQKPKERVQARHALRSLRFALVTRFGLRTSSFILAPSSFSLSSV